MCRCLQTVAQVRKRDEAVQQMIPIRTPAGHMQKKIQFRGREFEENIFYHFFFLRAASTADFSAS